jgi:two-component system, NarL family, invasion response regulator UvrY
MKVLIADDHAVIRSGVKQTVLELFEVEQLQETDCGFTTLASMKSQEWNLIILDLSLPGIGGLDILQQLKTQGFALPVLVLSFYEDAHYAIRSFNLGAKGYISKGASFDELKKAMTKVAAGGNYVSPAFAESVIFNSGKETEMLPHKQLSDREFQVFIMLARGLSLSEIGAHLFVSPKTVSTYRSRIMKKTNFRSNSELIMYAIKHNILG